MIEWHRAGINVRGSGSPPLSLHGARSTCAYLLVSDGNA
jgi:hypothetical protein